MINGSIHIKILITTNKLWIIILKKNEKHNRWKKLIQMIRTTFNIMFINNNHLKE